MTKNSPAKPTEAELLAEIVAAPDEDAPRLAYADTLVVADHPRGWWMRSMIAAADVSKSLGDRRRAQDRDAPFFRDVVAQTDQRARGDLAGDRAVALGFDTAPAPLGHWTMTLRGSSQTPDDDVFYELVYARGMLAGIDVREGQLRDLDRVKSVLSRGAIELFGATLPLLHAYLRAGALVAIREIRVHGPLSVEELEPLLALPRLRAIDLSGATLDDDDRTRVATRLARAPAVELVWPSPPSCRHKVDLRYRAVKDGALSDELEEKTWYFEVPRGWATDEGFRDLLHRIFFDANAAQRRREPNEPGHLALSAFSFTPIDVPETLAWDGMTTMESAAKHLPWFVAHQRVGWEPAACYVVDEAGWYEGMTGNDFSELLAYRALEEGTSSAEQVLSFLQKLYPGGGPGHGQRVFDDRAARLAQLSVSRAQPGRRAPNQRPCVSRLPVLDVDHVRAVVHGTGGSYRFRTTFGPGQIGADPYGGPGGICWSELSLYVRGQEQILFVETAITDVYGPETRHFVWVGCDGGRDFRLDSEQRSLPAGPDVERLAHVSLAHVADPA